MLMVIHLLFSYDAMVDGSGEAKSSKNQAKPCACPCPQLMPRVERLLSVLWCCCFAI